MNTPPQTGDTSRSAQRVATWRKEVSAFFGGEWPRLRELIMQLEEQHWSDTPGTAVNAQSAAGDEAGAVAREAGDEEAVRPGDRLSDIAWEIERRLCTNRPGRTT